MTDADGEGLPSAGPLARLEAYYDGVLRPRSRAVDVGAFTLFVGPDGASRYARPRFGLDRPVTRGDLEQLRVRQDQLGVSHDVEWVHERTPSLADALRATGRPVRLVPLLLLEGEPAAVRCDVEVRRMDAGDPELASVRAVVSVGFRHPGTARGGASVAERVAVADSDRGRVAAASVAGEVQAGRSVLMGAFAADEGAVGGGSHLPRDTVTEIVGVAVLPAFRRRGAAAALVTALARDALDSGVETVFCTAQSDEVAHVYVGVGFRRVGTAGLSS